MKSVFQKMSALLTVFAMMFAFTLTSCGDDDPEPEPKPEPSAPTRIGVNYKLELADTWWDFYNIEVTYTTVEGQEVTTTVTKGWEYSASAKFDEAATNYHFKATAVPKEHLPNLDITIVYSLDRAYHFTACTLNDKDEQVSLLLTDGFSSTFSMYGSQFAAFLQREKENLGNASWTIKK